MKNVKLFVCLCNMSIRQQFFNVVKNPDTFLSTAVRRFNLYDIFAIGWIRASNPPHTER